MSENAPPERKFSGKKLHQARLGAGQTRFSLAVKVGYTPMSIYKWEVGICAPNANALIRLADALGESVDYFYE